MRIKINSNHCNQAFNREINHCKEWIKTRIFDTCGFSSAVLLDCLMQRIAEMAHYPYALTVSTLNNSGENCVPPHGTKIDCKRVHETIFGRTCAFMEVGSGHAIITPRQWLSNQLEFFIHWIFCLVAILDIKNAVNKNLPAVLVFGIGEDALFQDGNDRQFINYCRLGPIAPLRNGKRLLIQSSSKAASSRSPDFAYSNNPLIDLLRKENLGFGGRLQLLAKHFSLLFAYVSSTLRFPLLSLLGKDFAYSSISFELDKRGLIESVILTCSSYSNQPLWIQGLRQSNSHMIWYAQNWRPLAYVEDKVVADLPQLRWIRVDTHWVWTHAFADYLRELGHNKDIKVVGPILWYLPEMRSPVKEAIEIMIFDSPAQSDEIMLRYAGEISNYYRSKNLQDFVGCVTSLKERLAQYFALPVLFKLKTKRGFNPLNDRSYFDYLEKLNSLGIIKLEHPATNLYAGISGSHLVIAYPFSTTAYIAEALNVPAIYFDPTGTVLRQDFSDSPSLIDFASNSVELHIAAISALSKFFPRGTAIH